MNLPQAYKEVYEDKNWNLIKIHAITHAFDNIEDLGATKNYNTKTCEAQHHYLKQAYRLTNFKNVAPQVKMISHVVTTIADCTLARYSNVKTLS